MTAQIVVMAEYREHKARLEWSGDPLAWTRAWFEFCARAMR